MPKQAVLANETLDSIWMMKVINDTLAVRVPVKKGLETRQQVEILSSQFVPSDNIIISDPIRTGRFHGGAYAE